MARRAHGRRRVLSTYIPPPVPIKEVSSGTKPLGGVGTATAAFVGLAPLDLRRLGTTLLLAGGVALLLVRARAATRSV